MAPEDCPDCRRPLYFVYDDGSCARMDCARMARIADVATPLLVEQVAPTEQPGGFGFVIVDPEAFTRWCAARGMTVEEYDRYLHTFITGKEPTP